MRTLMGLVFWGLKPKFKKKPEADLLNSTVFNFDGLETVVENKFLTYLESVDFIVLLPELKTDQQYQDLVGQIKPNIIAITSGDPNLQLKTNTIKSTSAKIVVVTKKIPQQSTSLIIKKL